MKRNRHIARILAMQFLCLLDVQGEEALGQLDAFLTEADAKPGTAQYARMLVRRAWDARSESDARLTRQLEHWDLDRLSPVERNVLRVALAELPAGEVPPKVIINEAVELACKYGGPDSGRFVNGIVDALWKEATVPARTGATAGGETREEPADGHDTRA